MLQLIQHVVFSLGNQDKPQKLKCYFFIGAVKDLGVAKASTRDTHTRIEVVETMNHGLFLDFSRDLNMKYKTTI